MEDPFNLNITVIPASDPKNIKLGWVIYENSGPFILPTSDNSCYEFDKADEYRGPGGKHVEKIPKQVWAVVPQLEFLNGQPWNNLALNYVMALRPYSIRVTKGCVHADAVNWRVTVYLEEDDRTIRRIEQECPAGGIGADCGWDLRLKLKQQVDGKKIEPFDASAPFINNYAVSKVQVTNEEVAKVETNIHEHIGPVIINTYAINRVEGKDETGNDRAS